MSTISDIGYSLSSKVLSNKLTIEERAEVFFDILSDLGWIGTTISCIDDAISYLQRIDNESKCTHDYVNKFGVDECQICGETL